MTRNFYLPEIRKFNSSNKRVRLPILVSAPVCVSYSKVFFPLLFCASFVVNKNNCRVIVNVRICEI